MEPIGELSLTTLKRLRWLRSATVASPWVALVMFVALRLGLGGWLGYGAEFPDGDRRVLTALILGSGAFSIIGWVVLRGGRTPAVQGAIMTACYVLVLWVAMLGAAAWGRGAPMLWFALAYAWSLAAMWGLFPLPKQ